MAKKKKLKLYTIKWTVWEYYQVQASSRLKALSTIVEDPYFVDYRIKRIVGKVEDE